MTESTDKNKVFSRLDSALGGLSIATMMITGLLAATLVGIHIEGISVKTVLSDILKRAGMNSVLVLAMVPAIQSGTGPNFALPIGIVCGLFAVVCSIQLDYTGFSWLFGSVCFSIVFAVIAGYLYGKLLNAIKGSEMVIATFTGFAITALFCLIWFTIPFNNPKMGMFMGRGLREMIQLDVVGGKHILNDFLAFVIGGEILIPSDKAGDLIILGGKIIPTDEVIIRTVERVREEVSAVIVKGKLIIPNDMGELLSNSVGGVIRDGVLFPTGLLLVFGFLSVLVWLFFRSKTGIAISAGGINPKFAQTAGLNIDRSRIWANILSTVLGAIGIVIYGQSFGFSQLYLAPLMMAFPAVAAILVGGATASRATVSNAVIGVFILQGLFAAAPPYVNEVFKGTDLSDIMRMIIQNGVILYALTQIKRGG